MAMMKRHAIKLTRADVNALHRSISGYRKLSPASAAEVDRLMRKDFWRSVALWCCIQMQRRDLGLPSSSLTPSEFFRRRSPASVQSFGRPTSRTAIRSERRP
jgi:hypothetical protein